MFMCEDFYILTLFLSTMLKRSPLKIKKTYTLKKSPFKKGKSSLKSNNHLNKGNKVLKKQSDKAKELWEKIRAEILIRDNKKCQLCGKPGTQVHHILLRSKRKDLLYSKNNLICLCDKCHNHTGTIGYMALSYRIAAKRGITVEELFKQAEKEE